MKLTVIFSDGTRTLVTGDSAARLVQSLERDGYALTPPEPLIYEPALGRAVPMSVTQRGNSRGGSA